jgi:hypothetical protein
VSRRCKEGDSWFDRRVSPSFLLISGLLLAPAVILQHNLVIKGIQTLLFLILALVSISEGRKRLVIGSSIFFLSTVALNLVSPVGRIMFELGPLHVTEGALRVGLAKATTVVSLLFLSRFCIRSSVALPGFLGRRLSDTFFYFSELLKVKGRLPKRNVVERLDEIFDTVYKKQNSERAVLASTTLQGAIVLIFISAANWTLVILPV